MRASSVQDKYRSQGIQNPKLKKGVTQYMNTQS